MQARGRLARWCWRPRFKDASSRALALADRITSSGSTGSPRTMRACNSSACTANAAALRTVSFSASVGSSPRSAANASQRSRNRRASAERPSTPGSKLGEPLLTAERADGGRDANWGRSAGMTGGA